MTIEVCTRPQVQHTWFGRRYMTGPRIATATTFHPQQKTMPRSPSPQSSQCSSRSSSPRQVQSPREQRDPSLRARVLWVGNVPQYMRDIDLKMLFTAAMQQHDRVTHVRIKKQPMKQWNSATIFLNRCVTIQDLICRMREVHKGHNLLIRKCRGKDRGNKENRQTRSTPSSTTSSPTLSSREGEATPRDHQAAQRAVASFFANFSQPPPPEVRVGTPVYDDFVHELDSDKNLFDTLLGLSIPQ